MWFEILIIFLLGLGILVFILAIGFLVIAYTEKEYGIFTVVLVFIIFVILLILANVEVFGA